MGDSLRPARSLLLSAIVALSATFLTFLPREGSAYTPHLPILIAGDTNFTAVNGVTGGSGTLADPYLIEGWEINTTAAHGIEVRDTTAFFLIRNAYLYGSLSNYSGVHLSGVANARLEGNLVVGTRRGVDVVGSTNLVIASNNVSGNLNGIVLSALGTLGDTNNVTVVGNTLSNNLQYGIVAQSVVNITVTGNLITGNLRGLHLLTSRNAVVSGNTLNGNGITFWGEAAADYSSHAIAQDNLVNGRPVHYHADCGGLVLDGVTAGQVIVANCTAVRIANLVVSDAETGVLVAFSKDVNVSGVDASRSSNVGLYVVSSENVTAFDNNLSDSYYGLFAWSNDWSSTNLTIRNNAVYGSTGEGIHLSRVSNATVEDNDIAGGDYDALFLEASSNVTAARNRLANQGGDGVTAAYSADIRLKDNDVEGNFGGVFLYSSVRVFATENRIVSNAWDGVFVWVSNDTYLAANTLSGNRVGAQVAASANVTLALNDIVGNAVDGVSLSSSRDVTATANNLTGNGRYGFRIDTSTGTRVFHNNFITNANQAYDDGAAENAWDDGYPSGGNYWSDYGGADTLSGPLQNLPGADGIGDIPRLIDANSRDRYPLVSPVPLVDNVPPLVAITSPSEGASVTATPVLVAGTASDAGYSGLDRVEVRANGGPWTLATGTSAWSVLMALVPGANLLEAQAWDSAGNPSPPATANVTYLTPPLAVVTVVPPAGNVSTDFLVDASESTDLDDPPASLEVRWDWEDDGAWDTPWSVAKLATHRYPFPGAFTIRLGVRDTAGLTATATRQVWVNNTTPAARFTVRPGQGDILTTFTADASASSDLEDPPSSLEVRWDWEDDGVWDTAWSPAREASHRYDSTGRFSIHLEVRDSGGLTAEVAREVGVNNSAPEAAFSISPATGTTETGFSFDASGSTDVEDAATSLEVRWDWDADGTWDTSWSRNKTTAHRFDAAGPHRVVLQVRDSGGLTDMAERWVEVAPGTSPPTSGFEPWGLLLAMVLGVALLLLPIFVLRRKRKEEPLSWPPPPPEEQGSWPPPPPGAG